MDVPTILHYFKEPLIHRRGFSLTLRNVAMDDEGARALSELLMLNHHIGALDVSANRMTGEGLSYLATSLEVNQRLIALTMDWNEGVGGEGLVELAGALGQSQALTSLSLKGVGMGDDTFAQVVDALVGGEKREWTKLDLSWNTLTDASAPALARLLAFSPVTSLHLAHNRFGDALLPTLHPHPSTLTHLDLSYNRLTRTLRRRAGPAHLAVLHVRQADGQRLDVVGRGVGADVWGGGGGGGAEAERGRRGGEGWRSRRWRGGRGCGRAWFG